MEVVAAKLEQRGTRSGLVRPLLFEKESETYPSSPSEFPNNNSIFIIGDYEELEHNFSDYDLFRISYESNSQFEQSHPGQALYAARSGDATRVEKTAYFHVIDFPFDPKNRSIQSLSFRPERLIVLRDTDSQTLYGPFDYTSKSQSETGLFSVDLKPPHGIKNLPDHSIFRFTENDFEIVELRDRFNDVRDRILASKLSDLEKVQLDYIDFISDDELVKCSLLLDSSDNKLKKAELREFRQAINSLVEDEPYFDSRKERLLGLIDRTQTWNTQRSSLINDYLKSEQGVKRIDNFLEINRDSYLEQAKAKYQKQFESQYGEIEKEIQGKQEKIEALREEEKKLSKQIEKSQKQKQEENLAASTKELEVLKGEIKSKENKLNSVVEKLGIANSIDELKFRKRRLEETISESEASIQKLKKEEEDLDRANENLQRAIRYSREELRNKLSDLKPFVDMLNGVVPSREGSVSISAIPSERDDKPATAQELIQEVQGKLRDAGREIATHELANYLVSIQQSFFTVFAGLPGVGKTSLITYLARVLGLEYTDRFLTIATARGWTSPRDLIGFYNPLSGNFQPSATGLFELLSTVQDDEAKAFPSWVLLDEANLSPLEHYFSTFLRMCDDYVGRELLTGDKGAKAKLEVPRSMRFLGTVNYDATTEPLSPRMLDRVPVIRINPPQSQSFQFIEEEVTSEQKSLLTEKDTCRLFNNERGQELEADELDLLDRIIKALHEPDSSKGLPIIISPRKQQTIKRFCSVARPLMREHYELSALDYAVAQHVLPLINGYGDTYRARLNDLVTTIDQLDHSKQVLASILEVGENEHGFYRFFV